MNSTCEVLRKAKTLIVKYGWVQGKYKDDQGYCARGAIWRAARHVEAPGYWIVAAMDAISAVEHVIGAELTWWNDQSERTKQEVVTALDDTFSATWRRACLLAPSSEGRSPDLVL